ncbi:AMP-binding protein [Nonomuraea dietziae]|uniref:AMP-binding protein n=1 Tax=Nonomuraea dietziae TaxID=65515 RepID=UPI0031DFD53C
MSTVVDHPRGSPGPTTVPDLLRARAALEPDRVALAVAGHGELTMREWHLRADSAAHGLLARGLRRGERVGLLFAAKDWIAFAVAYCAVQRGRSGGRPPVGPSGTGRTRLHVGRLRGRGGAPRGRHSSSAGRVLVLPGDRSGSRAREPAPSPGRRVRPPYGRRAGPGTPAPERYPRRRGRSGSAPPGR